MHSESINDSSVIATPLTAQTPQTCQNDSSQLDQQVEMPESTRMLAEAIKSLNPSRSQNYYVSNFDPAIHDFEVWCGEVNRAKLANNWQDSECLSRVSNYLRGDARVWLEWVTNDRTWSNFVSEFKSMPTKSGLCLYLF